MSLEIIKFDCRGNNSPAYSCNKPGDNSGYYVRALMVAKLDELRDLVTQMQKFKEEFYQYRKLVTIPDDIASRMEAARQSWKEAERAVYDWRP